MILTPNIFNIMQIFTPWKLGAPINGDSLKILNTLHLETLNNYFEDLELCSSDLPDLKVFRNVSGIFCTGCYQDGQPRNTLCQCTLMVQKSGHISYQ